jgi:pimeloyl-ACP methyl ester carboxylesterase
MVWGGAVFAQNTDGIGGAWQGTLRDGDKELRVIIEIARADDSGWKALIHSIDQITEVIASDAVTFDGPNLKLSADPVGAVYAGKVSADRTSIAGNWSGTEPDFLGIQGSVVPLELHRANKETAWQIDPTAHSAQFIATETNVRLEVLDWGGTGRPVVLIAGSGNTAHIFDRFATRLAGTYHVYGITRRGFGASSAPRPTPANYAADRLGDDVLAVIDALKLRKPVLVGHSLGGEELSSVGSRHPEKIAGLVYLDAGYHWAFYDRSRGDLIVDRNEALRKLEQLQPGRQPQLPGALIHDLLESSLPALEKDLREEQKKLEGTAAPSAQPQTAPPTIGYALQLGMQKYTEIPVPILAIYAIPHDRGITDAAARAAADARDMETSGIPAKAFEAGLPSSRVVILPHANHYVYQSNEAEVLREMNAFISGLPN